MRIERKRMLPLRPVGRFAVHAHTAAGYARFRAYAAAQAVKPNEPDGQLTALQAALARVETLIPTEKAQRIAVAPDLQLALRQQSAAVFNGNREGFRRLVRRLTGTAAVESPALQHRKIVRAVGHGKRGMVSAAIGQTQRNRTQLVHTKHALHFVRLGRCRVRGKRVCALVQRERQLPAALVSRHQRPRRRLGK